MKIYTKYTITRVTALADEYPKFATSLILKQA